jgi:hypothetical protein
VGQRTVTARNGIEELPLRETGSTILDGASELAQRADGELDHRVELRDRTRPSRPNSFSLVYAKVIMLVRRIRINETSAKRVQHVQAERLADLREVPKLDRPAF